MPKYNISSIGMRLKYLTDEEHPTLGDLPALRWIFIIVTIALGLISLINFLLHLRKQLQSKALKLEMQPAKFRIIILYLLGHLIHTVHYADNIYRPVDYFEPKWLYEKYLISEMEITFFINFPITLVGLIYMKKLTGGNVPGELLSACRGMCFYIIGSLQTLGHYMIEPPWKYSPIVNFTIGGEGVFTILLAIQIFLYMRNVQRYQQLMCEINEDLLELLPEEKRGLESERKVNFETRDGNNVRSRTPNIF